MIAGDKIKEARLKRGLSQEELGSLLGVTKVSICGYENSTRTPTLETFIKLIDELDLEPNELLGRNINIICDSNQEYGFKVTNEELELIKEIRKNKKLYDAILKNR